MKIGQRINLIRKIAKKLSEHDYSDGDLILRQFNIPWSDSWEGDPYTYYLRMVEQADDQKLTEVHEFLFPSEILPVAQSLNDHGGLWIKDMLRLFISHSSARRLIATQLKEQLKDFGIDGFVAHEDIEPTKEWLKEIQIALNTCHALVAILCSNFESSQYCDQEVGFALQRSILVIPIRLEKVDPYGFMAPFQAIVAEDESPEYIAKEVNKLISYHPTTKSLAEAAQNKALENLADKFLNSSNYGTSSELLRKLESYEFIPLKIINKVSENWEQNDQITGCMGIPRRMKIFFKKHENAWLAEE